jgi:GT2 family glycosyltransferase
MKPRSLAIVIVTMNRTAHLHETLRSHCKLDNVDKLTILDYGSKETVKLNYEHFSFPVRLIRIEHKNSWSLARAYNLAISLTDADYILKADADMYISQELVDLAKSNLSEDKFLTGNPFDLSGPLIASKNAIEAAHFFNQDLIGWGYEEIDLYSRMRELGLKQVLINNSNFDFIEHGDNLRTAFTVSNMKEITNLANCLIATLRSGLYSTEEVLSYLNTVHDKSHTCIYRDSWSDEKVRELSNKFTTKIYKEASGVLPLQVIPIALNLIAQEREVYHRLAGC